MLRRLITNLIIAVIFGGGAFTFKSCELYNLKVAFGKTEVALRDSISKRNAKIEALETDVLNLRKQDSLNRFFIGEKEKVLLQMRQALREERAAKEQLEAKNKQLEAWIEDAKDGIIIQLDTIKVKKKGLFGLGKGYKIIK